MQFSIYYMTCLAMQSETSLYRLIRRLHYYQPIKQNRLNLKQKITFFPISSDQNHGKENSLWNISLFCMKALIFCWKFQDDHKKVHLHFWWERHIQHCLVCFFYCMNNFLYFDAEGCSDISIMCSCFNWNWCTGPMVEWVLVSA